MGHKKKIWGGKTWRQWLKFSKYYGPPSRPLAQSDMRSRYISRSCFIKTEANSIDSLSHMRTGLQTYSSSVSSLAPINVRLSSTLRRHIEQLPRYYWHKFTNRQLDQVVSAHLVNNGLYRLQSLQMSLVMLRRRSLTSRVRTTAAYTLATTLIGALVLLVVRRDEQPPISLIEPRQLQHANRSSHANNIGGE